MVSSMEHCTNTPCPVLTIRIPYSFGFFFVASRIVDANLIHKVLTELTRNESDLLTELLEVIPATKQNKFMYDPAKKLYHHVGNKFPLFSGNAMDKIRLIYDRYELIQARMLRNMHFRPPPPGVQRPYTHLHTVQDLSRYTTSDSMDNITILCILNEWDGSLWASDGYHSVLLDFSDSQILDSCYTPTSIVLIQGTYYSNRHDFLQSRSSNILNNPSIPSSGTLEALPPVDNRLAGVFAVHSLVSPPIESRNASLEAMGIVEPTLTFTTPGTFAEALQIESRIQSTSFFLACSEVRLDKPETLVRLKQMLSGFLAVNSLPSCLILMGSFLSKATWKRGDTNKALVIQYFDSLADTLSQFPTIMKSCHVVLVPGPEDQEVTGVLAPQPPIPFVFCKKLIRHSRTAPISARVKVNINKDGADGESLLPFVTLATNPCRIRFVTREILVYRKNITEHFRMQCLLKPYKTEKNTLPLPVPRDRNNNPYPESTYPTSYRAVRTALSQSTLIPLPVTAQPVAWTHAHAMQLHPLPNTVLLGDGEEEFEYYFPTDTASVLPFVHPETQEVVEQPVNEGCLVVGTGSMRNGTFAMFHPIPNAVEISALEDDEEIGEEQQGAANEALQMGHSADMAGQDGTISGHSMAEVGDNIVGESKTRHGEMYVDEAASSHDYEGVQHHASMDMDLELVHASQENAGLNTGHSSVECGDNMAVEGRGGTSSTFDADSFLNDIQPSTPAMQSVHREQRDVQKQVEQEDMASKFASFMLRTD